MPSSDRRDDSFAFNRALLAGLREPATLALARPAALPVLAAGIGGYLYQLLITMALARVRCCSPANCAFASRPHLCGMSSCTATHRSRHRTCWTQARAAGAATMESLRVCFTAAADWLLFGIAMDALNVAGALLVVFSASAIVAFK